jgi:HAD superfamily hydrolase (TIGR01509 family)
MFDAVIFDWDGTLADTKRVVVDSFQKVLKEIGCKVSDEFIARLIGIGTKNTFKEALKTVNITLDDETLDELVKKKIKIQIELTENVNLFEGAVDLLNSLHNRVKIALATMSNREVVNKLLSEKRVRKYFEVIITADEILQPKPNPEVFLECAKKLKCLPEKCVVIEDSVFGVKAAKKAKMKCIAIPSGTYSIEELGDQKPDLIVNSINEKEKILNFILG